MAAGLLSSTGLAVKQIAAMSGYENRRELERDFHHMFGMSPIVYRSKF
jgi:transcriptional regulator GlxA family with amidase domain